MGQVGGKKDKLEFIKIKSFHASKDIIRGFPGGSVVESACQFRRLGFHLCVEKIPWRRKRQPIPVFFPGKSHGQVSLVGYSPRGLKKSDTTE